MIFKFAHHDNVPTSYPTNIKMFDLHDRLAKGEKLTREEQETVIGNFYGLWGQQHGATYQQAGWQANFHKFLRRFLVNQKHYGWKEYYSFNRTMLRKILGTHNCLEITEIPNKH